VSAKSRGRANKSLQRRAGNKPVRATFRIYTEGTATEPEYIDLLRKLPELARALSVEIAIESMGAQPMVLVDMACADKRRNNLDIDQYWCVFDVESPLPHPKLLEARAKAKANGVELAISNPCFELWLVLHHQYLAKYLTTDEAVKLQLALDGGTSKHIDPSKYSSLIDQAEANAARLRGKHLRDGTQFPNDNPSTTMDKLTRQLVEAARIHTKQ